MNTSIRTNELEYFLDKKIISEKYDIFSLETSDKYIKHGSYILDASILCNDIKSIKFESGRKILILMNKSNENKKRIKELFKKIEDGDTFSIEEQDVEAVKDYLLIQLLLNALGSYESEVLKYNNLTGHLYCFHPNWIKRGKEKQESIIWKIPCLELSVTSDLRLDISVKTFTSERLRNKITFKKRKFEDYPKYIFAANNTLRRRLKEDKETSFIQRQVDGVKSEITFLDIQNIEKFEQSKMGVLNYVIKSFNQKYAGISSLKFREKEVGQRLDYTKSVQRENALRVKEKLASEKIRLVDIIGDEYSRIFCEKIKDLLKSKYDLDISIGKKVLNEDLNLLLIHNADYYEGENDPHDKKYEGIAVQHITFEDFADSSEFAIDTVIHELIIKKDLQEKKISLFDWPKLGFTVPVSFGIETEINEIERFFFMKVNPNGSFEIKEQVLSLFEMNEYSELVGIFENAEEKSEVIKGLIRLDNGNINVIKDTGLFTIPEVELIEKHLREGDNKLRGKERREELLSSCLDIKTYEENGNLFYFVGIIGEGMRQNIQRGTIIRKIDGYNGAPIEFNEILPMMNVSFVKNGQLTVMPFPFKYLREYISAL